MADELGSGAVQALGAQPRQDPLSFQSLFYRDPNQPPEWRREWSWGEALREPLTFLKSALSRMGDKPTEESVRDMVASGGPISTGALGGGFNFLSGIKDVSPLSKVAKGGKPTMVFHGTPESFPAFKKEATSPQSLYGQGFYFTENPDVAAGYAFQHSPLAADIVSAMRETKQRLTTLEQRAAKAEAEMTKPIPPMAEGYVPRLPKEVLPIEEQWRMEVEVGREINLENARERAALLRTDLETATRKLAREVETNTALGHPQTRPAYLDMRKPWDMNETVTEAQATELADAIERLRVRHKQPPFYDEPGDLHNYLRGLAREGLPGERFYAVLNTFAQPEGPNGINVILREAGYDGLMHTGGRRVGNVEHPVWIPWDEQQIIHPYEPMPK